MKKFLAVLVIAGVSLLPVDLATANTPATLTPVADPAPVATNAVAWLASQVTPGGYIESVYVPGTANFGVTAQAVLAFASAGVGRTQTTAMMTYLAEHVDDYVSPISSGVPEPDSAPALAQLILDAVALGQDPHAFGGSDLVNRLEATQQSNGLFGAGPATYDGVFRQSLALLALHATGNVNPAGLGWLQGQECAGGGFESFRADTSIPCGPADAATFSGPDTNSTAMAVEAFHALGVDTSAPVTWLRSVRAADGGFPYFGDPTSASDADSTGLVLLALTTAAGTPDAQAVTALTALQVPCSGATADRGGIAFQAQDGTLYPDALATTQALWGLGGHAFSLVGVTMSAAVPTVCMVTTSTTSTSTIPGVITTVAGVPAPTASTMPGASVSPTTAFVIPISSVGGAAALPVTGGGFLGFGDGTVALFGAVLFAGGALIVTASRRRTPRQGS